MIIGNLEGYFDGSVFHKGPVTFEIRGGKITDIRFERNASGINASGHFASVPFTDGHTHLIFAGDRSFELPLKVKGASYAEILERGGGIHTTVQATREASDDLLLENVLQRLDIMLEHGTHVVEAKSGYGLDPEHELRLLRVLKRANKMHEVEVVSTFCGAHAIPSDRSRDVYVQEVIDMMDEVRPLASSTDVFCDRGAFNVEETISILQASKESGIPVKVHAEELQYTGIAQIASEQFNAISADHLLLAKHNDFETLARNKTTAMFMPAAVIGLFSNDRPTGWKDLPLKIGLGSDFNPNNMVYSMQTATRLAVFLYWMDPVQAFRAATVGSYEGITRKQANRLVAGASASLNIFEGHSIEQVVSRFDQNMVRGVIKDGKILRLDINNS